jgi:hypothetical protein
MKRKQKNPGAVPTARGAGIGALAERGALPKQHITASQAAQRTKDGAVVRPRKYRGIIKWMAGRSRVVIRSKCADDPAIVITVDNGGRQ